jgi:hypothetical protein
VQTLAAGLAVQRPASATATLADIQCDLVAELHWLKAASTVQWLTAIPARTSTGNVITLLLSELTYTARVGAA